MARINKQFSTSKIFLINSNISTATGGSIRSKSSMKKMKPKLLLPNLRSSSKHSWIASCKADLNCSKLTSPSSLDNKESTMSDSKPTVFAAAFAPAFPNLANNPLTLLIVALDFDSCLSLIIAKISLVKPPMMAIKASSLLFIKEYCQVLTQIP